MVRILKYKTLQSAWIGVNKYLAQNEKEVCESEAGGGVYGTEYIAYNNMLMIDKAWVDPEFDFGKVLGYNIKKWTTLVKNYVDFNYLDLIKSEVTMRTKKKAKSYNYAYHFANKYGGGKDCLVSLVFSKRVGNDFPTVFFVVRTSEITCRLIFDFLLIQRICEYVFGEGYPVEIEMYLPSMYITAERFSMFADHYGWNKIKKKIDGTQKFSKRIIETYNLFKTKDVETIKYKVHLRCAQAIQKDENGDSIRNVKSMKAKDLPLLKIIQDLPSNIITKKQFNKYIKENQ